MKVRVSRRYMLLMAFILVLAAIYSGGLAMAESLQTAASLQAGEKKILADSSSRINQEIGQQILERSILFRNIGDPAILDFDLRPTGRSQFELSFKNPYNRPVQIKIYNIIGNIMAVEEAPAGMSFLKTYNFSEDKMRLFVVEVGNQKHNLTKKVTTI